MRSIFLALVITLAIALPAVADRDDYYCVGPDYLAEEFRSFSPPGLAGPHVKKTLHFDQDADPRWAIARFSIRPPSPYQTPARSASWSKCRIFTTWGPAK